MTDTLILAPLLGLTDAVFRNTHHAHFGAFDEMMAPYIVAHGTKATRTSLLKKIYDYHTQEYKLIPQLLGNDSQSLVLYCNQLFDLGFNEVNWNLGCPYKIVTRKIRGAGLLPFPERIASILESVLPNIKNQFSVKIRLGLKDKGEIYKVLDAFNQFPLHEIIIHPRTADQKYEGSIYLDDFEQYLHISKHPIVFNGDIFSIEKFDALKKRFPEIKRWMIGRGIIANPLLASDIKYRGCTTKEDRKNQFWHFHDALFQRYRNEIQRDTVLLNHMKEFWSMISISFDKPEEVFDRIKILSGLDEFRQVIHRLKESDQLNI